MAETLPLVKLNGAQKQRLVNYLDAVLKNAMEAHSGRLAEERLDDKFYDAKPEAKNFPWPGCSNIRVPIARIMVDSVKARVQSAVEDQSPKLWTTSTSRAEEFAVAMTEGAQAYMEAVAMRPTEMNMGEVNENVFAHTTRLGYAPIWVPYKRETERDRYYDRNMILQERARISCDGVKPELVLGSNFLTPPDQTDIQTSDWIARKVSISTATVKRRVRQQRYYSEALSWLKGAEKEEGEMDEQTSDRQQRAGVQADKVPVTGENQKYHCWEVHFKWDLANDGNCYEMVALYHPDTLSLLRLVYNHYAHRQRPFVMPTYSLRENDPWSGGIVRRLRPLNVAIDTMLNQSIDNATVANTRIWKYQANEPALKNGLRIHPSAGIALRDVNNLKGEQLGEIYPSSYQLLSMVQQWAERDVGLFDTNLGNTAALKSDVAATSVMATMQEGGTRLNTSIKELRRQYALLGMQAFMNYQQFNPVAKGLLYLTPNQFEAVQALFNVPVEDIQNALFIELTATTAALSRQIKRQDAITLWQILVQYYAGVVQLGQQAMMMQGQNAQLAEGLWRMIDQSARAFRQVLVDFEIPNPDEYVITSQLLLGARQEGAVDELENLPTVGGVASAATAGAGSAEPARISSPIEPETDRGEE